MNGKILSDIEAVATDLKNLNPPFTLAFLEERRLNAAEMEYLTQTCGRILDGFSKSPEHIREIIFANSDSPPEEADSMTRLLLMKYLCGENPGAILKPNKDVEPPPHEYKSEGHGSLRCIFGLHHSAPMSTPKKTYVWIECTRCGKRWGMTKMK